MDSTHKMHFLDELLMDFSRIYGLLHIKRKSANWNMQAVLLLTQEYQINGHYLEGIVRSKLNYFPYM